MYLLDTNVVSEMRKIRSGKADPGVAAWAQSVSLVDTFLSVITIQELEIGTLLAERKDPRKGNLLREWLDRHILAEYLQRILPITLSVARRSARLHVPDPGPVRDALIAATAADHGLVIVTRNGADFRRSGVEIINPWNQ